MGVRIVILGDVCPDWGYPELFATGDAGRVFNDVLPILREADYVVANLEAPAIDSTERLDKNSVNLRARPRDVWVLANAGIRAVALANNHILDYGVAGLRDTLANLDSTGIAHYGAGDEKTAYEMHVAEVGGIRVGFLAFAEREFNCVVDYGEGAALWDDLDGVRRIRVAKEACDYLVVQYHGGIEHYRYPSPDLQKRCRAMAEAGADLVLCQHSHIIGTREQWMGSEILYGQGNAVFGKSPKGDVSWNQGLLCKVELSKCSPDVEACVSYVPVVATAEGERLADAEVGEAILAAFEERSKNLIDPEFVLRKWAEFCSRQAPTYLPMLFGWGVNAIRMNKLLGGRLASLIVGRNRRRNVMNLIRCDAHREVLETILEEGFYGSGKR